MIRIGLLTYAGVDELDLVGAYSPLIKAAQCLRHRPELHVMLLGNDPSFQTSGGMRMDGAQPLGMAALCDALVVPGGRGAADAANTPALVSAVHEATERGAALFSVCSGALVVAAAGIAATRLAIHQNKQKQLRALTTADITRGLTKDMKVVSVGGLPGPAVKAVSIAFAILDRYLPECVPCISERMEILPQTQV